MKTIEMCAGAGGQALGLHNAGFQHSLLVEIDAHACATLRHNNEYLQLGWGEIIEGDLRDFAKESCSKFEGQIDLVAGGVPCPPFSKAGQQKGHEDERDLFPAALEVVKAVKPLAVMLENVPGLMEKKFDSYRAEISDQLKKFGYKSEWRLIQASDFGVPQLRPRVIMVALKANHFHHFAWPEPSLHEPPTVGEVLYDLIASKGWKGADEWKSKANKIAPTLVGGSKKHGGPDLGPTRAKNQWKLMGVNAHRIGNDDEIPDECFRGALLRTGAIREGFENMPLLNVRMAARLQGFPDDWHFVGTKTNAYRQVGNAFPPPVAEAVGRQIHEALSKALKETGKAA